MIDIAIIGDGPSGLSAAISAKARNKKVCVFGNGIENSAIYKAELVNNYLGLPAITGKEMMDKFYNHAKESGAEIIKGRVFQILSMGDYYGINCENEFYEAKSVIISTGIEKSKKIKGEEQYLGKGVSYCATCDGMLYRNKEVVLVGEAEESFEDLKFLNEICKKVYFIDATKLNYDVNASILKIDEKPLEVIGEDFVTGLKTDRSTINCEGIFFIKKTMPVSNLISELETEKTSIKVSKNQETNLKGIFACGDCTGSPYQVAKAVGEGLTAALSAVKYLDAKE